MSRILLAGATGYLGSHILKKLIREKQETTVIVRHPERLQIPPEANHLVTVLSGDLTQPQSISNCCNSIDTVISTVGITKPKDRLTYMQVDYQANLNLLREAQKSGVRKFIYISVFKGEQLRHIDICKAKERFVDALKIAGPDYCIVRPTGYFSDMAELFKMAQKGRVYLFNKGAAIINPISGEDLAEECVRAIQLNQPEINIGGPQTMSFTQLAQTAFEVLHTKPRITYLPKWVGSTALWLGRLFLSKPLFGPFQFFMTVMTTDMNAPEYGRHTLKEFFSQLPA